MDAEFNFDFDPCPSDPNRIWDGLHLEWKDRNFCNPPYNEIKAWIRKGFEEHQKGKTVVFLIPSRTDTIWWHEFIMKAQEIRFIKGRLSFDDKGSGRATFPSAIVIFK